MVTWAKPANSIPLDLKEIFFPQQHCEEYTKYSVQTFPISKEPSPQLCRAGKAKAYITPAGQT